MTPRPARTARAAGVCVVRRPWSVRAMEGAGAMRVGARLASAAVPAELAKLIDHTLLKPEATRDEVVKAVRGKHAKHRFASVCVNSTWVPLCKALLAGSDVMVCAGRRVSARRDDAVGQGLRGARGDAPGRQGDRHGHQHRRAQVARLRDCVRRISARSSSRPSRPASRSSSRPPRSTPSRKIIGCTLSKLAGAAFVKTSTGSARVAPRSRTSR